MPRIDRRSLELNELAWWSNWATLSWLGQDAHLLVSRKFPEPFFNRAGFLACRAVASSLEVVGARFRRLRTDPTVLVYDDCTRGARALARAGYAPVDKMAVMMLDTPGFRQNGSLRVEAVSAGGESDWSRAYLRSFYGETGLLSETLGIVARIAKKKDVTLLEGLMDDEVAGVLAIQRSKGLAGIYCVGTVPRFRRQGVSGALISSAAESASREGRKLVLQTLESDGVEGYYRRGGFRRLYAKSVLSRRKS